MDYKNYFKNKKSQREDKIVETVEEFNFEPMNRAIEAVRNILSEYELCDYVLNEDIREEANGQYITHSKTIEVKSTTTYRDCLHEIGHHIHHVYFRNEALRIPRTTDYSRTNHKEAFAEAFKFYVLGIESMASHNRMSKLMESIK